MAFIASSYIVVGCYNSFNASISHWGRDIKLQAESQTAYAIDFLGFGALDKPVRLCILLWKCKALIIYKYSGFNLEDILHMDLWSHATHPGLCSSCSQTVVMSHAI